MKVIIIILILATFASCCSHKDKGLFYIIKPIDFTSDSMKRSFPVFYSDHNFILYNDTVVYYHNLDSRAFNFCGTGLDGHKPEFLRLNIGHVIEIPLGDIESFWRDSISLSEREKRFITISSTTDTIRNKALLKFLKLSDFSKKNQLNIRKCTEEQLLVADAKFKKLPYSSEKAKWKTGFDDSSVPYEEEILKFIPPIEE